MIAKGGRLWIISVLSIALTSFLVSFFITSFFMIISITFLIIVIFFIIFFRDPHRSIGENIVAPADGKIRDIKKNNDTYIISTFMNVYNVHVNRMPINGRIISIHHFPGKHIGAWKKEAEENEKVTLDIQSDIGNIRIIQIAGCIARRIYPYVKNEDVLKKGDKIGIIRFGSRVDLYLSADKITKILVKKGDKVYAGVTSIAQT
ncbi:MAG: phosphatidylserine decarboxylase [Bacillota bacterium]